MTKSKKKQRLFKTSNQKYNFYAIRSKKIWMTITKKQKASFSPQLLTKSYNKTEASFEASENTFFLWVPLPGLDR